MNTKILDTIDELRVHSRNPDVAVEGLSDWSIGLHVHHCILVIRFICEALGQSSGEPPTKKWDPREWFIFLFGWIPRGKGKAPKRVTPMPQTTDQLLSALDDVHRAIVSVSHLHPTNWVRHPVFGTLTRDKALRFIFIHNTHHLKIIRDITQSAR